MRRRPRVQRNVIITAKVHRETRTIEQVCVRRTRTKSTQMHRPRTPAARKALASLSVDPGIGNKSVPIRLAQCRFQGLAISDAKYKYILQIKYTEALLYEI